VGRFHNGVSEARSPERLPFRALWPFWAEPRESVVNQRAMGSNSKRSGSADIRKIEASLMRRDLTQDGLGEIASKKTSFV